MIGQQQPACAGAYTHRTRLSGRLLLDMQDPPHPRQPLVAMQTLMHTQDHLEAARTRSYQILALQAGTLIVCLLDHVAIASTTYHRSHQVLKYRKMEHETV